MDAETARVVCPYVTTWMAMGGLLAVLLLVLASWIVQRLAATVVRDDDLKQLVRSIACRIQNGHGAPRHGTSTDHETAAVNSAARDVPSA